MEQLVEVGGPQPPARVAHILAQVCGALGEAHEDGLIHRDVKPANILLVERGGWHDVAKVVDFGLVKEVRSADAGQPGLTQDGSLTGTPMYLSPETLEDPDAIDGRSDLYALGAVAYYLLAGEPVFTGKTVVEICGHHLHSEPPPLADRVDGVPPAFEDLVLACLAKEPDDRFASASELRRALAALDLAAWSEADAERWWRDHDAEVKALSHEQQATTTGLTVAIDLAARVSP